MITENQNTEWKESWRNEHINNPDIANAFFRAGMIESWGRGIEKIIGLCATSGLPEPVFDTSFGGLQVEFLTGQESQKKMTEKILMLIKNNPTKSNKLERIGPDKGGYWKVIE